MELQLFSATTTTIILTISLFLYFLLKSKKTNKTPIKPPTPSNSLPIIGHLHLLNGLPHITLGKLADKYGPIFMIKLGFRQTLVISNSEVAKQCLGEKNDKTFLNRPKSIFVKHLAYDSAMLGFSQYGQYWREIRKITTVELLSNHRIEMFKDVRISEVKSSIKKLSETEEIVVDMKEWFNEISLNIIVRLIAGKTLKEFYKGEKYDEFVKALREFFELAVVFVPGDVFPFLRWFDIGGYERKMTKVSKKIDEMVGGWLEEHKERRKSLETEENQDFMDVMIDLFDKEKPCKFDEDVVTMATCMAMILAGSDTTAVTLTWALSLLLNNKDVLKKAQLELDTIVGKERQVDESDLKNLVYLQAVLKETLRLYPAAPLSVPRESIFDCTVSGYHIPADTQLFVNLYKIHRDPQVWEDPARFDPERFRSSHKDYDVRGQNYEYMPFGSGRRICPGISFALQVMQFTLANLLQGFDISIPSDEVVDMTEGFGLTNLKATPLQVILKNRLPQELY